MLKPKHAKKKHLNKAFIKTHSNSNCVLDFLILYTVAKHAPS